jgi:hypothetical protein
MKFKVNWKFKVIKMKAFRNEEGGGVFFGGNMF